MAEYGDHEFVFGLQKVYIYITV